MLVSAISVNHNGAYKMSNKRPNYTNNGNESIKDTAFNSLTPYSKKSVSTESMPQVFDSINQWKNFCHKQILGEKLNVVV